MSVFIIPTHESRQQRPSSTSFGRCGPSSSSFDPFLGRHNAIPRGLFGALLADDDDEVLEDDSQGYIQLNPWQQHVERIRRQEYLQEVQRRQRILQARRQQQQLLELERERERQRAQRERLARIAWHREQQQRAAAQEYQRRLEAHRQRQQQEYAERVRLAKAYEHDWEQVATEAVFGMINLAQQLFGGEDEDEEKKEVAATTAEKKPQAAEQEKKDDEMQVDQAEDKAAVAETQAPQTSEQAEQVATEAKSAGEQPTTDEQVNQVEAGPSTDRLIFTYPLPADESIRSSIQAKDIHVKYDEASRTIHLNGLWQNEASNDDASSTVGSDNGDDQTRGRKRSRSPKHSRVSDVDEKTGEEITTQDDEDYVEVTDYTNKSSISKTIPLPEDASAQGLRAEITDDGFQVWVR